MPCIGTGTGAEVWTRRLAEGLRARGLLVQLDVVPHRYQYAPWLAPVAPPDDTALVIANSWSAAAFAGPAPLMTVVHHVVHDPALSGHKSLAQKAFHRLFVEPMERAAIARSASVVAVSESTRDAVARHLGFAGATTVLNGVDTGWFAPAAARGWNERVELLFVGKPSRRKRFDLVAAVAAELGDRARLTVVGPPPDEKIAMQEARYLGRVSDERLRQAYREADLLLLPSTVEGFGYAAAEALACGTPVACAPGGAVAEIARPGIAAITVTGDPATDARAIAELVDDRPRHDAMRTAAREVAVRDLDQGRWLDEMEALVRATMMPSPG